MGFYEHYASRPRIALGVKTKLYQAKKIFFLAFEAATNRPKTILEIGPGDGYVAKLAVQNNCSYLGLEGSKPVAASLSDSGYNIVECFVPPLPPGIGSFDVCYMLHVIEHMKDMDAATKLIAGIREHLNTDGVLVIACPDYSRWKQYFYDCDYTHSLPFTKRRLRQLLLNEGFDISFESIYAGPIFGYLGLPLFWLAKVFYPQFFDDISYKFLKNDLLNRGFLTLMPNLIAVAKKR